MRPCACLPDAKEGQDLRVPELLHAKRLLHECTLGVQVAPEVNLLRCRKGIWGGSSRMEGKQTWHGAIHEL